MSGTRGLRLMVVAMCWSLLALGAGAPTAAAGAGVTTMAVGSYHSCVVRADTTVWCWGMAESGQLGDGTYGDGTDHIRTRPVRVLRGADPLRGATKVALGASHSCAVRTDGGVWCWGESSAGQLGNGEGGGIGTSQTTAVRVRRENGTSGGTDLTGVKHIAAGTWHTCALRSNGSVWCWGQARRGQVGDGTTGYGATLLRPLAVRVRQANGYLSGVVGIAAGQEHSCAVKRDGSAWCWGDGSLGQLGDGDAGNDHYEPRAIRVRRGSGVLTKAAGIAAGGNHTCARRSDGTVWCWGDAADGQIGDGTTGIPILHMRLKAVQVHRGSRFLTGVAGVAAGTDHSCARRSDGSAWCWGADADGQLGDGTTGDSTWHRRVTAVRVERSTGVLGGVRKLAGGAGHTCALRVDHSVWCWGMNRSGQLGRATHDSDPHPFPRKVAFP